MSAEGQWARRLVPPAVFQFCFVASINLLKAASNALVLAHFQADALPYLYVGAAALAAGLTGAAAARAERRSRAPVALAAFGAGACGLFVAALIYRVPGASLALYLFAEAFATYAAIQFWSAMGKVFDPQEARRAFTMLGGIGMGGAILGGVLAQALAKTVGAISLLPASAVLLGVAAASLALVRVPQATAHARHRVATADVWGFMRQSDYARLLGGFVLALAVFSALADYLFRQRAAEHRGVDELAALFGNLNLWMALLAVAFQLFIAERLLRGLGILRYLALVPVALLPLSVAALVEHALWPAYLLRLVEQAASLSILPVAVQLLYAPVPDALRDGVRSAMDGLVKKGGLALAGVALVGAGRLAQGSALPAVLVLLCGVALFALFRFRPAYVSALQAQVSGADAQVPGTPGALGPLDARRMEEALGEADPERALNAAALLEQRGHDLRPRLAVLLKHPHERVQTRGVQLAVALSATEVVPEIERLTSASDRRPRDAAVWALAQLAPDRAMERLPSLLSATDIGLRCAAIGALLGTHGGYDAQMALQGLAARGALAPVAERREVARLLGRVKDARWAPFLLRYLEDGDSSVRRIALAAAGEARYVSLAPRLLPFLTWREERRAAREALAAMGDAVMLMLEEALNDRARPPTLRYQVPRVMRQVGTARALEALLFSNVQDDAFLHYRIGVALFRLREEHPELPVDAQRVREAIGRRRQTHRQLLEPYRDLRASLGTASLLTRAVGDRLDQAYELSFWLLGLIYPARPLRRVHEHFARSEGRARAYAAELFEHLVPASDRALVDEQTAAHHRRPSPGTPGRLAEHLGALCHSDDQVLRACARRVARGHQLWKYPRLEDDMSDATVDRMFALEKVEIFAHSDVDDIAAVAAIAREERYAKGERIYDEGDPGDALYVLLSGQVNALRRGESVLTVQANQAFGDVSLLDGSPRPTEMVAAEDVVVLSIDRRDFLDLLSDRPELLKGLFRAMSQQLTRMIDLNARRSTGEIKIA